MAKQKNKKNKPRRKQMKKIRSKKVLLMAWGTVGDCIGMVALAQMLQNLGVYLVVAFNHNNDKAWNKIKCLKLHF